MWASHGSRLDHAAVLCEVGKALYSLDSQPEALCIFEQAVETAREVENGPDVRMPLMHQGLLGMWRRFSRCVGGQGLCRESVVCG